MVRKQLPAHIYRDVGVDESRVRLFANAPLSEQLRALTYLRQRTEHLPGDAVVPALALGVSVVAYWAASRDQPIATTIATPIEAGSWLAIALTAVLGLVPVLIGFQFMISSAATRRLSRVWLEAYRDEIHRRQSASGRDARKWQRAHPIRW